MRAVLDTNIWVSGIAFRGEIRKIIELALEGRFTVLISLPLLEELQKVLSGRKVRFGSPEVSTILFEIQSYAELIQPHRTITIIRKDDEDNRVLECAVEGKADLIVSGDAHLLVLKQYRNIPILSARDFLDRF